MTLHAWIFAETPVKLWGLTGRQRLERILKKLNIDSFLDYPAAVDQDTILLLRGDYLYDERLLKNLVEKHGVVLRTADTEGRIPVAAHAAAPDALYFRNLLEGSPRSGALKEVSFETPQTLASNYLMQLRKMDPPYLLPVTEESRERLEKRLFAGSYKGVTDLVTKWVWPRPAQWATRFCVRKGITPNQVTSLSLVLVVAALLLFLNGFFFSGLAAAWVMTFLDTVDGKLARVTVKSSTFGHIFDHAIDLISPPFWYLAWGLGLQSWPPGVGLSLKAAFWLIFVGYIIGRLVEGLFRIWLEPSGIFCWRPIDSCFRLITGRRNPNLILLTAGRAAGRPDLGLLAVALWTVVSSIFLVTRLMMGVFEKRRTGRLRSWFLDIDPEAQKPTWVQRCFSNRRS